MPPPRSLFPTFVERGALPSPSRSRLPRLALASRARLALASPRARIALRSPCARLALCSPLLTSHLPRLAARLAIASHRAHLARSPRARLASLSHHARIASRSPRIVLASHRARIHHARLNSRSPHARLASSSHLACIALRSHRIALARAHRTHMECCCFIQIIMLVGAPVAICSNHHVDYVPWSVSNSCKVFIAECVGASQCVGAACSSVICQRRACKAWMQHVPGLSVGLCADAARVGCSC